MAANGCAVCARPVCSVCDRGDRHISLCSEHEHIRVVQGWAELCRMSDEPAAQLLASALQAADIDAHVLSQMDHAHMIGVAGMAVVRVLVPAAQYESARRRLAEIDAPTPDPP